MLHHYLSLGEIQNVEINQCLNSIAITEDEKLGTFSCMVVGCNQVVPYADNKEIRTDYFYLDVSKLNGLITMLKSTT